MAVTPLGSTDSSPEISSVPTNGGVEHGAELAYLGPPGTYGHQAAHAFMRHLGAQLDLVPCPTISAVHSHPARYLVMPLENTIHGIVTETIDALLSDTTSSPKSSPRIIGDLDLPIRHCLVARKGTNFEDIEVVRSHEQALGQSQAFLKSRLPNAKQEKTSSTAGAALSLLAMSDTRTAAICSMAVVALHPDELEVLHEGTQDIQKNFTRFILLQNPSVASLGTSASSTAMASAFYTLSDPSLLPALLQDSASEVLAVHSRPIALESAHPVTRSRYPTGVLVELGGRHGSVDLPAGIRCIGSTDVKVSFE